jgi:hypothetical protein
MREALIGGCVGIVIQVQRLARARQILKIAFAHGIADDLVNEGHGSSFQLKVKR